MSVDGGDQCGGPEVVQGGERSGLRPGTVRDTPSHRHSQEEPLTPPARVEQFLTFNKIFAFKHFDIFEKHFSFLLV